MKTAYVKKVVSNIVPVLASVCWMRSVYHTQYFVLQDLFVKFLSMGCRKCYNKENISKILRRMKENGGDFILRRYSGGISFQNTSPIENYEDNLMLTWNPGQTYLHLGMPPGSGKYLSDVCPPEYHKNIDQVFKIENEYRQETERIMKIVHGPKREDISDTEVTYWHNIREEEAVVMIDLRRKSARTRRAFTIKIENIVRQ